jgi:adenylate cyclase class 2
MAHQDTEVEIKIRLDEGEFSRAREAVRKAAKLVGSSSQVDRYLTPIHRNLVAPRYPWEWLSIRKRGGKAILNYKHWHPAGAERHTHCDEYETELGSPEQLEKLLKALDFRELVTVEKERETFNLKGELEIAMDSVKGLGKFIEIEALKDFGGVAATRQRIMDFAKSIGLDTSMLDKRGYPYLLMEKKGLIR